MAVTLGVLLLPRASAPQLVPLPIADARELARTRSADHALALRAQREPLPDVVRALGSALRDFHAREAREGSLREMTEARRAVDDARIQAEPAGDEALLRLRAVQLESFLSETERFEATGIESGELQSLAGGFVASMRAEGWLEGHRLAPGADALRVLFKTMWNTFLGVERLPAFQLSLDEERALYAFYLLRPHPSAHMREAIAAARRGASSPAAYRALEEAEQVAVETWRIERIERFAAVDSTYPAAYAMGVAQLRRGDARAAANAFRTWLEKHSDGPYTLVARNGLRAANALAEREP